MYRKIFCVLCLLLVGLLPDVKAGTFKVNVRNGQCLLEMPRTLLGRIFLGVSRLDAVGEYRTYQPGSRFGDEIIVSFKRGEAGKVDVYLIDGLAREEEMSPDMQKLLMRNRVELPLMSCPVVRESAECVVIDITEMLKKGEPFFDGPGKSIRCGGEDYDSFHCTVVREMAVIRRQWKREGDRMTEMPVTTTFFLLPEHPLQSRERDLRVGYSSVSCRNFTDERTGARFRQFVRRWNLIPKDREAYFNGVLTEPEEPIVFYLDPAIPTSWKPYYVQAVEDWQQAFEEAGFRNAIVAREIPEEAKSSLASLRGLILYQDSLRGEEVDVNTDPRSGQIIQARVHWSPMVLDSLMCDWVSRSVLWHWGTDMKQERVVGELIRVTLGKRIGMALGLLPNELASAWIPVEKLRDNAWLTENGMSSSIMGEVMMNTVAQWGDRVELENLFPRVGTYDCWAINWGYRYWSKEQEKELEDLLLKNMANAACWWNNRTFATSAVKAEANMGSSGSDPVGCVRYALENVKRAFVHIGEKEEINEWVHCINDKKGILFEVLLPVLRQFAGIEMQPDESRNYAYAFCPVSRERQEEAMEFLNRELFATPQWLMQAALSVTAGVEPSELIATWQETVLEYLFEKQVTQFALNNKLAGKNSCYTLDAFLDGLYRGIWSDLKMTDPCRDNLRVKYLNVVEKTLKGQLRGGESVALQVHLRKIATAVEQTLAVSRPGREVLINYKTKIEDVIKNL